MNFGKIDHFLLFGGGKLFADMALRLKRSGRSIHAVTSQRHLHEGLIDPPIPLGNFLEDNEIDFLVSSDVNNDRSVSEMITPQTLGVSIGAAWIFRAEFIERFTGRLVNSHGARLPQDRGGGGFSWRILRGDHMGFSLIHQVEPGIDTGAIIAYQEYHFPYSCRVPIDYQKYSLEKNLELFDLFLSNVEAKIEFPALGQPEYLSTYWPRLSTDLHGYIDWSWELGDIERFICAFDEPYAGAMTFVNDTKVRLKNCLSTTSDGRFHPFQQGIIYRITDGAFFVAVTGGSLIVNSVTDESGSDMTGHLCTGDRFYTEARLLDEARRSRVIYTPKGLKEQA